ncbi:beta-glucosidase [Devriesea agamarum]|uniref:beta-glucosidase n=1 Tax=Devriesea agamarum TaxID=472569 RepID=UPI00071CB1E9|nr:glycoside hydrolase family 3 C-terminal domain-containing protein [Devriesea agamarum]
MPDAQTDATPNRRRRPLLSRTAAIVLGVSMLVGGSALTSTASPIPSTGNSAADIATYPWLNKDLSPEARADLLMKAMNEDQLIHMLHGDGGLIGGTAPKKGPKYIGYIPAIPELRVPAVIMTDGPSGLRNGDKATEMPAPITQAASFDPGLARSYGKAIAQDARDRGQDVLFSPGFNLARNPTAGRTFEYFGEDPLLSGEIAAAHVEGVQSTGLMATIKHYVANNQETNRTQNSSNIDDRTLHEIYEKPFQIAIAKSDPAIVMCAYNKVNNKPACGNPETLKRDLRENMKFKGFVVTDYPAAWSPTDIKNGLNVELPGNFWTSKLLVTRAIKNGDMSWDDVRTRVRETLVQMFRFGLFDHPWDSERGDRQRTIREIPVSRGQAVAQKASEAGSVLLKNDGILPLNAKDPKIHRVTVVGDGAKSALKGGGSSAVNAITRDNLLDRIKARYGDRVEVDWVSEWNPAGIALSAKKSDLVIVVATTVSTELFDRPGLNFMPHVNNSVNIAARRAPTIVVTQNGGPVLMPWLDSVKGVLNTWYPGEAGGEATARLLFGEVDPSGRLPQTFPASNEQKPASHSDQFPGSKLGFQANYTEGVFMGYRWYSANGQKPLFPFGYGLSYTTFSYSNVALVKDHGSSKDPLKVRVTVTNTGKRTGKVVPQVYIGKPSTPDLTTPPRELGAFTKVELKPGEQKTVEMTVDPLQLAIWKGEKDKFVVRPGTYRVMVGNDVNDIAGTATYQVK